MGMVGSLIVGVLSFVIRNSISRNATKESVSAKTDLLEKDIAHITKELQSCENKFSVLHKRVSDLRDSSKEIYVSKEVFHQTIKQLNDKLDTILKFVKK
jgi:peptidoglycan hydrolase CwlO-like protein